MHKTLKFYPAILLLLSTFAFGVQAQSERAEQLKFLKKNSRPVKINNPDFSDLRMLDKVLKGKRIVLLGEFTHGSKEINLIKNRIIAYLHKNLGFNVLLLESGIGEVYQVELARDSLSNRQMIKGLTGPWQTAEYLELMDYLKTNKNLKAGGFDVQRTGRSFSGVLSDILTSGDKRQPSGIEVEQRYTNLTAKLENRKHPIDSEIIREKEKLVSDYRNLLESIEDGNREIEEKAGNLTKLKIIKRIIENRIEYLNYYLQFRMDNDYRKRFAARDSLMAENVLFFANEIYKNEKIIISAHNFHIAKQNEKELVMGEVLAEKFGDSLYSIGIFGGSGELTNNAGKTETLMPPGEENNIQTFITALGREASFLDIPKRQNGKTSWLFQKIKVNNSFVNLDSTNELVLQESFDGLILINKISPPNFTN